MESNEWRAPSVPAGHEILFSEPGRVLDRVDYCSHWFRVTREGRGSRAVLRVRHGAGNEAIDLGYAYRGVCDALALLDSDNRYRLLYALFDVHGDAYRAGAAKTRNQYTQAFVDGRLRKRKNRNAPTCRVWIEPARAQL